MATVAAKFTPPFDNNEIATTPLEHEPAPAASGTLRASLHAGPQLRAFKASLQFLAKISAELLVEAFPDRLVLRAINPSRSAFGAVTLRSGGGSGSRGDNHRASSGGGGAFTSFDVFDAAVVRAGVPAKHLLAALRGGGSGGGGGGGGGGGANPYSHSHSSKPARLSLELRPAEGTLRARVVSESLLVKEYELAISGDAEILHAAVDAAALPAGFVASPAGLNAALGAASFAPGASGGGGGGGGGTAGGEVTVVITAAPADNNAFSSSSSFPSSSSPVVELRSYSDGGAGANNAGANSGAKAPVRTTLRLDAAVSLRDVRVPPPDSSSSAASSAHANFVDVTLSARDLRAVLPLCESLGADASFRAACPGAPVLVEAVPRPASLDLGGVGNGTAVAERLLSHEVQLVLATLAESAIEPPPAATLRQQAVPLPPVPAAAAAPRAATAAAAAAAAPPPPATRAPPAANFDDDDDDEEAFLGSMAAVDAAEAAAAAAKGRGGRNADEDENEEENGDGVAGTPPDERPGW